MGLLQDFQPRWDVLHLLVERTPLAAPLMMNYGKMCSFTVAATTKFHTLRGLKPREFIFS